MGRLPRMSGRGMAENVNVGVSEFWMSSEVEGSRGLIMVVFLTSIGFQSWCRRTIRAQRSKKKFVSIVRRKGEVRAGGC